MNNLTRIFEKVLNESLLWYHGSDASFKKPKLVNLDKPFELEEMDGGFYVTNSLDAAITYSREESGGDGISYVYTVMINPEANICSADNKKDLKCLQKAITMALTRGRQPKQEYIEWANEKLEQLKNGEDWSNVFRFGVHVDRVKILSLLKSYGYDGYRNTEEFGHTGCKYDSICVWNPNVFRIVNRAILTGVPYLNSDEEKYEQYKAMIKVTNQPINRPPNIKPLAPFIQKVEDYFNAKEAKKKRKKI